MQGCDIQLLGKLGYLVEIIHIVGGQRHVDLYPESGFTGIMDALYCLLPTLGRISEPVMMRRRGAVDTDGNPSKARFLQLGGFGGGQKGAVTAERGAESDT